MVAPFKPIVLVVLDGLGDLPHPALADKTPLEAAVTPNLDKLAAGAALGRISPVREGVAPESDAGVMGLLGFDPEVESPGRGVLEAMGIRMELRPGDVALRFNFATADASGRIIDQRVGRNLTTPEATDLAKALTDADLLKDVGIEAVTAATVGHRGVLRLRARDGAPLSADVTNSDPFYLRVGRAGHAVRPERPAVLPVEAQASTPEAARTAQALNLYSQRVENVLAPHRVNGERLLRGALVANRLIFRDAGVRSDTLPTFQQRHGIQGAAVTEMPVERGIALLLGLSDHYVGPMGKDAVSALNLRAQSVLDELRTPGVGFVYVHLKGPDEPGHDGDAVRKKKIIEDLDNHFFGPFLKQWDPATTVLAITADHSTPCVKKGHSDDPVPLLVSGLVPAPTQAGRRYTESDSLQGALGLHRGVELVPFLRTGSWTRAR